MRFPNVKLNSNKLYEAIFQIGQRKLKDHLENRIYGADVQLQQRILRSKLSKITSDNLFGKFEFKIRKAPNATFKHHSSVSMMKGNKTVA